MPPPSSATHQRLRQYIAERMRMVGNVLTGNGITRCEKGTVALVGGVAEGFCVGEAFSKRSS
jgi:hypothetical protein